MSDINVIIKLSDTEMFSDFIQLLKTLHRENPQLKIDEKVKQIATKHHYESDYFTKEQNDKFKEFCLGCLNTKTHDKH